MSVAPEAAIEVTSAMRPGARLRVPRLHAEPDAARVAEAAAGHAAVLLTGGEPTLRADLPRLLAACAEAGAAVRIRTDGLALGRAAALAPLQRAGLTGLRVLLASARRDAHDWLVGLSGAATAASRAVRVATAAGLPVEVEIPIARPTAPLLAETVNVAARLGAFRPVVVVDYVREAYTYPLGNVRITFDKQLAAGFDVRHFFDREMITTGAMDGTEMIMEVKFDEFLPGFVRGLLVPTVPPRMAISKFALCRRLADRNAWEDM